MYCLFCVILCIVHVYVCTELLPPGGYPTAVKYISHHIIAYGVNYKPGATRNFTEVAHYHLTLHQKSDIYHHTNVWDSHAKLSYFHSHIRISNNHHVGVISGHKL
jgi:hypothetical protein